MTKLRILSTVVQWLIIVAIGVGIFFFVKGKIHFTGYLNGAEVILFALSISFALVEVAHIFPCLKCVTGWVALILALLFHTPFAWLYLFVGLMVGALFGSIKMRWL
jgi:hypothetical protein